MVVIREVVTAIVVVSVGSTVVTALVVVISVVVTWGVWVLISVILFVVICVVSSVKKNPLFELLHNGYQFERRNECIKKIFTFLC